MRQRSCTVPSSSGCSVSAFINGLLESKTELAVVLGERTVLDTIASVEPISFVLGRSGRLEVDFDPYWADTATLVRAWAGFAFAVSLGEFGATSFLALRGDPPLGQTEPFLGDLESAAQLVQLIVERVRLARARSKLPKECGGWVAGSSWLQTRRTPNSEAWRPGKPHRHRPAGAAGPHAVQVNDFSGFLPVQP